MTIKGCSIKYYNANDLKIFLTQNFDGLLVLKKNLKRILSLQILMYNKDMKEIYFDFYKAPFCILKIIANEKGVISIEFVKKIGISKPNKITKMAIKEIDGYFNKKIKKFNFPISISLHSFQKLVLNYIKKIPYGRVKTYKDVAKGIGKDKSSRAVGQVLKKNPLPLFFPCHRIVRSDGTLGGFGGGIKTKENLLKLEGFKINELFSNFV